MSQDDPPVAPANDDGPDPDELGTTEGVSDQSGEEGQREAVPSSSDPDTGQVPGEKD